MPWRVLPITFPAHHQALSLMSFCIDAVQPERLVTHTVKPARNNATKARAWPKKKLGCAGQATLEAAYLIPIIFLLLLLLVQPGILLYDLMVMQAAAGEGCRLLVTRTDVLGTSEEACEAYVKRRLGAIPPHDQFHMHSGGCTWDIEVSGDESSEHVEVIIRNKVKLLPLFDAGGTLLGLTDASGAVPLEVSVRTPTQPAWAGQGEEGLNPEGWVRKDRNGHTP